MSAPTEERSYYFKQYFAFSTNYLDYGIPDFRGSLAQAVPVLVMPNGAIVDAKFQPISASMLHELIENTLADKNVLVCNDAVRFHQRAMQQAGDSEKYRDAIWRLTDHHALWDVCLLEQRVVWGIEGRAIGRPNLESLLGQYHVPSDILPTEGLRHILLAQFERLIDELPFLANDIVGHRIFRESEFDSPYIPAPTRVLARDRIHFKERLHVFLPLLEGWRRCGPACIGIDVQAAVTKHYLDQPRRQMPPESRKRFYSERNRLRARLQESSNRRNYKNLRQDRANNDGSPAYSENSARSSLKKCWREAFGSRPDTEQPPSKRPDDSSSESNTAMQCETITDENGKTRAAKLLRLPAEFHHSLSRRLGFGQDNRYSQRNRRFPCNENGEISLDPIHWGNSIPPVGPLHAWADYHVVLQATHFDGTLHHAAFPYLKSCVTEFAERHGIPLLAAPSSDRVFLEFRIRDMDLLAYLCTHRETDFILETGRDGLEALRQTSGQPVEGDTPTVWSWGNLSEALPSPVCDDGVKEEHRLLPADAHYSRDFWESPTYFSTYRYFERPREERDEFLASILEYVRDDRFHENDRWTWFLPSERRNELFFAMTRLSIKGLLRGFTAEMIADQMQELFGDAIPYIVQGHPFSFQIEQIHRVLLGTGRFRGMLGSSLYDNILPRLCIDPVYRRTLETPYGEEIRLDGEWQQDTSPHRVIADPLARESVGDVTDYNQLARRQNDNRRFWFFLEPLIVERCRDLQIDNVIPSETLVDRLYSTNPISCNGKPGRPVWEFEIPFTSWTETLDDLKKAVSYSITRTCADAGTFLTAVSEESFVVEVDRQEAASIGDRLASVIYNTAEHVLGIPASTFGHFIETSVTNNWPSVPD